MSNVNISGGILNNITISNSDIIMDRKTLDLSGSTLTLANDQISGDKVEGGTIGSITISQLAGAMDCSDQLMSNVNISGGILNNITISNSDIIMDTKTLDLSGATLTLANDQISGDKVEGGTIGSITISQLAGAMDCSDQLMSNVNIVRKLLIQQL